jgi:hypothetical protein
LNAGASVQATASDEMRDYGIDLAKTAGPR